jgi:hypothetical protein
MDDPTGDTFGTAGVQHDIDDVSTTVAAGTLSITVTFTGPIAPGSAFSADSVVGFIDLDVDQEESTGANIMTVFQNHIDAFTPPAQGAPPPGIGVEFYIDLFSEFGGFVDIVDASDESLAGTALITFVDSDADTFFDVFTVDVPLGVIGGDDGQVNLAAIIGNYDSTTDQTPNNINVAVIPEPSSLTIFGLGLVGLAAASRRRRR